MSVCILLDFILKEMYDNSNCTIWRNYSGASVLAEMKAYHVQVALITYSKQYIFDYIELFGYTFYFKG